MPQYLLASQSKRKGRRNVGRPTLRWLENTENDLQGMKSKRSRHTSINLLQNRYECAFVVKGVKFLSGR
jgi:hypothetical protein